MDTLFANLYGELHRTARRELFRRGGGLTLSATTLVHEAYLGMSALESAAFPDRARFMAYAARAMRGLVIDHVRRRSSQKRGGQFEMTALETTLAARLPDADALQDVSDALDELAEFEPALAEVVDLKVFCGFSVPEIAAMRGVTERTVQRQWEKARLFLHRTMSDEAKPS
jgi:RNA polymerase sigma factor (TIGR02999 family)